MRQNRNKIIISLTFKLWLDDWNDQTFAKDDAYLIPLNKNLCSLPVCIGQRFTNLIITKRVICQRLFHFPVCRLPVNWSDSNVDCKLSQTPSPDMWLHHYTLQIILTKKVNTLQWRGTSLPMVQCFLRTRGHSSVSRLYTSFTCSWRHISVLPSRWWPCWPLAHTKQWASDASLNQQSLHLIDCHNLTMLFSSSSNLFHRHGDTPSHHSICCLTNGVNSLDAAAASPCHWCHLIGRGGGLNYRLFSSKTILFGRMS